MIKRKISYWIIWIIGLFIILFVWGTAWYIVLFSSSNIALSIRELNLDVFTAVSVLFSGLVLIAVIVTFISQIRAISVTKEDLTEQQLETNFFRLIEVQNRILQSIEKLQNIHGNIIIIKGRKQIGRYYDNLNEKYKQQNSENDPLDKIKSAYNEFFRNEEVKSDLGHYFRHLYHIVKYIHNSKSKNKQSFINLLRAQLSTHEQLLLFYNCLSEYGSPNFKILVEKYALLENMPNNTLDIRNKEKFHHRELYKKSAFNEDDIPTR